MPGSATGSTLAAAESRDQVIYGALIANGTVPASAPQPVDLTISGAITASGTAQTITIDSVSLPIAMQVGQHLLFRDSAGSYLVKVTTLAASGTTTTFTALALENIPDNAVAQFPCPIFLAQEYSTSDTTSTSTFSSFDHAGSSDSARGDSEQSVSFSVGETWYNAGAQTLRYAKENEIDVTLLNYLPNPDSDVFTTNAPIEWLVGKVTDGSRSGANNEKLITSFSVSVDGGFRRVDPD